MQHLAHLAHGAAAAVGDDIRGHRGSMRREASIHLLDHAFTLRAARQIEIDVRPGAASLAQEALKQQLLRDGIDVRDAEAVTHGAVCRAAATLHEDAVLLGPAHDVPHDEEVAAEAELRDQPQFMIELMTHLGRDFAVAFKGANVGALAQKAVLRVPGRHGILRELVAEVFEAEFDALDDSLRALQSLRKVVKQLTHLRGGFQAALGVRRESQAGFIERGVMPQRREGILQHASLRPRIQRRIRGDQRQLRGQSEVAAAAHAFVFTWNAMTMNLDENMLATKNTLQALQSLQGLVLAQNALFIAGEHGEAFGVNFERCP